MLIEGVLNEVVFEFTNLIVLLKRLENINLGTYSVLAFLNCIIEYCAMWITSSTHL